MSRTKFNAPAKWPGLAPETSRALDDRLRALSDRVAALESQPSKAFRTIVIKHTFSSAPASVIPLSTLLPQQLKDGETCDEILLVLSNGTGGSVAFQGCEPTDRAPKLVTVVLGSACQFAHQAVGVDSHSQFRCPGGVTMTVAAGGGAEWDGYRESGYSAPGAGWFSREPG